MGFREHAGESWEQAGLLMAFLLSALSRLLCYHHWGEEMHPGLAGLYLYNFQSLSERGIHFLTSSYTPLHCPGRFTYFLILSPNEAISSKTF